MANELQGKRVAILATDGFEQIELTEPRKAIEQAGASTDIIAPHAGTLRAWNYTDWGDEFRVEATLDTANAADYDALLMPGGVMNPDKLRIDPRALQFVRRFFEEGKPVASICHGPWTLIDAGVVKGRKITSWPSLQTDLRNAGAQWVNQEVVTDQGLVTSRGPQDIPAFCRKIIEEFGEGVHPVPQQAAQPRPQA